MIHASEINRPYGSKTRFLRPVVYWARLPSTRDTNTTFVTHTVDRVFRMEQTLATAWLGRVHRRISPCSPTHGREFLVPPAIFRTVHFSQLRGEQYSSLARLLVRHAVVLQGAQGYPVALHKATVRKLDRTKDKGQYKGFSTVGRRAGTY